MDSFLQACRATGPLQLHLDWPGSAGGECLDFETPYVVVGHAPGSDLVLEHMEVCDRHAYLQLIGGRLYCVDMGSRGGTLREGEHLGEGWVEPHQSIRIGPYQIRPVGGTSDSPGSHDHRDLPPLTLDLLHRGSEPDECPLAGSLTLVGSSTDCQVRLLDPDVSNIHCSLLHTPTGVWVVDLLGGGGIRVNGASVRHARLRPGDELLVGGSAIHVRHESEPEPEHQHDATRSETRLTWRAHLSHELEEPLGASTLTASYGGDDPEPVEEAGGASSRERPGPPRSSRQKADEIERALAAASARDRRGSCRYPVDGIDALLSWYEPVLVPAVRPPVPKDKADPSPAEDSIYSRIMSRWSAGRNGTTGAGDSPSHDPMPPVEMTRRSCVSKARLIDLSQTGLLVLSEAVPPDDQRLWLRLIGAHATDWVEVVLKGASPGDSEGHRIRLAFLHSCPYDFFKLVMYNKPLS